MIKITNKLQNPPIDPHRQTLNVKMKLIYNNCKIIILISAWILTVTLAVEKLDAQTAYTNVGGVNYPVVKGGVGLTNVNGGLNYPDIIVGYNTGKNIAYNVPPTTEGSSIPWVNIFAVQLDLGSSIIHDDLKVITETLLKCDNTTASKVNADAYNYAYNIYLAYNRAVKAFRELRFCDHDGSVGGYIDDNFIKTDDGKTNFYQLLSNQVIKEHAVRHAWPSPNPWQPILILSSKSVLVGIGQGSNRNQAAIYFCSNFTVDQKHLSGINGGLFYLLANITMTINGYENDPYGVALEEASATIASIHYEDEQKSLNDLSIVFWTLTAMKECTKLLNSFTSYYTASYDTKHIIQPYYTTESTNAIIPWSALNSALNDLVTTIVDQQYGVRLNNVPPVSYP